jgi:hypothetical protein
MWVGEVPVPQYLGKTRLVETYGINTRVGLGLGPGLAQAQLQQNQAWHWPWLGPGLASARPAIGCSGLDAWSIMLQNIIFELNRIHMRAPTHQWRRMKFNSDPNPKGIHRNY